MIPYGLGLCQLPGGSHVGKLAIGAALDDTNGLAVPSVPHLDLVVSGVGLVENCNLGLGVQGLSFLYVLSMTCRARCCQCFLKNQGNKSFVRNEHVGGRATPRPEGRKFNSGYTMHRTSMHECHGMCHIRTHVRRANIPRPPIQPTHCMNRISLFR